MDDILDYKGYQIIKMGPDNYEIHDDEDRCISIGESESDCMDQIDADFQSPSSLTTYSDSELKEAMKIDELHRKEQEYRETRRRRFAYSGPFYYDGSDSPIVGQLSYVAVADNLDTAARNIIAQFHTTHKNLQISRLSIDKEKVLDENVKQNEHVIDKIDAIVKERESTNSSDILSSSLTRYNANSTGKASPDCVPRAISFALKLPYTQVKKEIAARGGGGNAYMYEDNFVPYIVEHGCVEVKNFSSDTTVDEFADSNPTGAYILNVGKTPGKQSHLCCIIDNVIYDSWDCSGWYVYRAWKCPDRHIKTTQLDYKELGDFALPIITNEIENDVQKSKFLKDYKFNIYPYVKIIKNQFGNLHAYCMLDLELIDSDIEYEKSWRFAVDYVLSPETTMDEAKEIIEKTTKVRIYDRIYSIAKEAINDVQTAVEQTNIGTKYNLRLDNRLEKSAYKQLPADIRARVSQMYVDTSGNYSDKYQIIFDPLPGDPRKESVRLKGFNMDMINEEIKRYRDGFQRMGYGNNYDYQMSELETY